MKCYTCGSTTVVDGDCPHCNPPVGSLDLRLSWDDYFFSIACAVASRASCPRASVGAVIVSLDHRILSTGYNGSPPREPHCFDIGCLIEDGHCQRVLHAEVNAIAWAAMAGVSLRDGTLYIYAIVPQKSAIEAPCRECRKVVKAAGINRVLYREKIQPMVSLE